jgi:hypothetical protein
MDGLGKRAMVARCHSSDKVLCNVSLVAGSLFINVIRLDK